MNTMRFWIFAFFLLLMHVGLNAKQKQQTKFFAADHSHIRYTGRIDFSNPKLPRFWQPGVYIETKFSGPDCEIIVKDEELWGKNHNYLEIVVDGKAVRLQTTSKQDTIVVAKGLSKGVHRLLICKNTEANIGYMEFVGLRCKGLVSPGTKPAHKIEFIGNSITCGASSDASVIPCGKGVWHDQHNAYLSYGPTTARSLKAQYHLSSVSGIGLMHSCCDIKETMPQLFDKTSMRNNEITWNFKNYQPDLVTICLGQNDGVQDSTAFCNNYIAFIKQLRQHYPKAMFVCLSSPMADANLFTFMKKALTAIVDKMKRGGEKKLASFFFSKQYRNGCDYHPDLADHKEIAKELVPYLKKQMNW